MRDVRRTDRRPRPRLVGPGQPVEQAATAVHLDEQVGSRRHVVVGDSVFEVGGDLRRRRGDDRGRRHRDALPVRETAPDTPAPGFESPIAVETVELAEEPRVLVRIEVPDEGAYDPLGIGVDVEVVATEYREDYDHGELSGYSMFAARPV